MTEGVGAMRWILVVSVLCSLVSFAVPLSAAVGPRFTRYAGPFAYGLEVVAPWQDGGTLIINLPEHLERWPGTQGILRHNDKAPKGHWQVSEDGKRATLDVESSTMPGIFVKGAASAVGGDRVELTMQISNTTDRALPGIRPLYCFQYRHLTGFPQWIDNFKHTYVLIGGKAVALADIPTERADADVKGAYVRGCTQRDSDDFPRSRGGLIEDRELDAAIIAVEALKGPRKVVMAWTPGKSMLSNAAIPCAHGDPFYGPVPAGEAREAEGIVWFTEKPVEEALKTLAGEGHGAPAPAAAR